MLNGNPVSCLVSMPHLKVNFPDHQITMGWLLSALPLQMYSYNSQIIKIAVRQPVRQQITFIALTHLLRENKIAMVPLITIGCLLSAEPQQTSICRSKVIKAAVTVPVMHVFPVYILCILVRSRRHKS